MRHALRSFAYSLDYLREQVADVPTADMARLPPGIANHPAWVIGHLTYSCELLAGLIDLPPWLPDGWIRLYGPGSVPVDEVDRYEPKEPGLDMLREGQVLIESGVERLSEEGLDTPFPNE